VLTVLTSQDLAGYEEFGATVVVGGERELERALVLAGAEVPAGGCERALVVVGPGLEHPAAAHLVRILAEGGAAGLVLAGTAPDDPAATELAATAKESGLPLLASGRTLAEWEVLAPQVAALRAGLLERQYARLAGLLDRLPAPGTGGVAADERGTVRKLAAYLSEQLDAQVLVRGAGGVLAAAPEARPPQDQEADTQGRLAIPLNGDATLLVATDRPAAAPDRGLAAYTAKAIGLALAGLGERQAGQAVDEAVRRVRVSALQLLMSGHPVPAQRVIQGISGDLLDSDTARVYIIDCAGAPRDAVLTEAERALRDAALPVRCPAFNRHVIIVAPQLPGRDPEPALLRLLGVFAQERVMLGGSLPHPMEAVADAYGEAMDALALAARTPTRHATASRTTGVLDVLPPEETRAWAIRLLRPVLAMPRGGRQILETAALAVEFERSAAARVVGVHRNTVTRRVQQVFDAVGLDHELILHRVVLSLAAQVVGRYGVGPAPEGPGLHALLTAPEMRCWAEKALRPLAGDRRDLLRTLRVWVGHGCRFEQAAAELGIATKTVRSHIRAAEPLLRRDLVANLPDQAPDESEHRLSSVRPLALALYATTPPGTAPPPLPVHHEPAPPRPATAP